MMAASPTTASGCPAERTITIGRIVRIAAWWSTALLTGLGAVLVFGGPARVSAPSFKFVAQLGGAYVWGCGFLALAGTLTIVSLWRRSMVVHALRLAAVGFLLFAMAAAGAAVASPIAGLTGIIAYTWMACLHVYISSYARGLS